MTRVEVSNVVIQMRKVGMERIFFKLLNFRYERIAVEIMYG